MDDSILQFFKYEHLGPELQSVSAPFCNLARQIAEHLPVNRERTMALRKLLEAKDCAVRAYLFKEPAQSTSEIGSVVEIVSRIKLSQDSEWLNKMLKNYRNPDSPGEADIYDAILRRISQLKGGAS